MSVLVSTCISYHLAVGFVLASNSTSSNENDATMKALLTVGILVGCVVIALVVSKIVDSCYDHHIAISDNASDVSEDTRKLVRLRLAINAFSRIRKNTNDSTVFQGEKQRKIIRMWSARAKESRRVAEQRMAEASTGKQGSSKGIIKVEEAMGDSKITTATVAAQFLTLSETKSSTLLSPDTAGALSPNVTPRPNTATPHKPERKKTSETIKLSSRPSPKSSPAGLQTAKQTGPAKPPKPAVKVVVTGVDTDKHQAEAASATNKTHSGNRSVEVFSGGLRSCSEVFTIDLEGWNPETCEPAIDLGQDSVRSESDQDLVALSCRSDIQAFTGSLLQGLGTTNTILEERQSGTAQSHKTGSGKSDQSPTPAASLLHDYVVLNVNNTESSLDEAEKEVRCPPGQKSPRTSTPTIRDTKCIGVESTDAEPPRDSCTQPENYPEGFSIGKLISPRSRKIFTITPPTEHLNPDTSKQVGDSGNELPSVESPLSLSGNKLRGRSRPESFSVRDMTQWSRIPPKMADSVRLYTSVRDVFKTRKEMKRYKKTLSSKAIRGSTSYRSCSVARDNSDQEGNLKVNDIAEELPIRGEKF
ncbi:hypothetical protein ACOMHN_034520 [Nucella lapillus]